MRATTFLSLVFGTVASAAVVVTACANGGDDSNYSGDDGGLGDATTGGDGPKTGDGAHGDTGLACTPVGPSSDCTMPTSLGTLTPGQMVNTTGNIATAGGQAYVTVSFAGNLTPAYHPQIALTEGESEFAFDILSDCSGTALACGDGDAATGNATWEDFYGDAADFASDAFVPIETGNDGGVVVRIYRRTGLPLSCNQYALTVSE